jgi:hypothetical protein
MPEELWEAAVSLAAAHGVYRVSQGLRVNYETLKARLARSGQRAKGRGTRAKAKAKAEAKAKGVAPATFVEIKPAPVAGHVTEIEVESETGAKLTVRLGADAGLDVCGVVAAFVGGDRRAHPRGGRRK